MFAWYVLIFGLPSCWFQTLWLSLLAIPPLYNACFYNPNMCHSEFHFGCRLGNGVFINNWRCRDETESLLWVHIQGCAARHVLISRLLVMIHYRTTLICYFHVSFSLVIFPYFIKSSLYRTNCSRASSWNCLEDKPWRTITDININRLQEVVDKWIYLAIPLLTTTI
jgi:hypothetical protein